MMLFVIVLCSATAVFANQECIDQSGKDNCHYPYNNNNRKVFYKFGTTNDLYTTHHTIVNLVAPLDGYSQEHTGDNWLNHPPIFFNLINNNNDREKYQGQYVLINKTAHKIFDGRDATLDRSIPKSDIYFAGKDGIYIYDSNSRTATKYGTITEDVLAIEKVTGKDEIYILAADHKIYKVTNKGKVKTKVQGIKYAKDFIIDLHEAIYFIDNDNKPQVLKKGERVPFKFSEFKFNRFNSETTFFSRPSLNYEFNGMIFMAEGVQYFLLNCSTVEIVPNTGTLEGITGYNAEGFIYQFIAVGGDMYEHNLLGRKDDSGKRSKEQELRERVFERYDVKKYRVNKSKLTN